MADPTSPPWPVLDYAAWRDTRDTLQLWTQVVGKIRLGLTPWLNHSWHVPLYVTSRGLATSPMAHESTSFEIEFDFIEQVLAIRLSDGRMRRLALRPQSVADFYAAVMAALADLGVAIAINEFPCEIAAATDFSRDRIHTAYDADYARRFWEVLLRIDRILKKFRTGFMGKCSPVHFFWGSFDLAVTRFSGRRAPPYPGKVPGLASAVMREAYSHEVSSAGFWPGGGGIDFAAFYSYAYPTPTGFRESPVRPAGAYFHEALGEFLLPYDAVRTADDPDAALLAFLQSTYEAAARTAAWDRGALECPQGSPGVPRVAAT
ncbi:MAG: DUF5996 family protein [Steroidobacteraceae bacterium]